MLPAHLKPLTSGKSNKAARKASLEFLDALWRYPACSFAFIGIKANGKWIEHPIKGASIDRVAEIFKDHPASTCDIYFCPNAFNRRERKKEFALRSHFAWCDIDDADPKGFSPRPNILWETSPGRHQGIWIWDRAAPGDVAERYSRSIVYGQGGDNGGWSITKMMRLPGTINHKPDYANPIVTLKVYDPTPQKVPNSIKQKEFLRKRAQPLSYVIETEIGTQSDSEIIHFYRRRVSLLPRTLMCADRIIYPDRSEAIFIIASALVIAGATDFQIITTLLANPHFIEKHGSNRSMAEREVHSIRAKLEGDR